MFGDPRDHRRRDVVQVVRAVTVAREDDAEAAGQCTAGGCADAHLGQHAADGDPTHLPIRQQLAQRRVGEAVVGALPDDGAAGQRELPAGPARLVDLSGRAIILQLHDERSGVDRPPDQLLDPLAQRRRTGDRLRSGQQPALHVDDDQRLDRFGHRPATRIATRTSSSNGPGPRASRSPASKVRSVGNDPGDSAEYTLPTMRSNEWVSW